LHLIIYFSFQEDSLKCSFFAQNFFLSRLDILSMIAYLCASVYMSIKMMDAGIGSVVYVEMKWMQVLASIGKYSQYFWVLLCCMVYVGTNHLLLT
jgi:hypothetical protein